MVESSHIKTSLKENQMATLEECKEEEMIIRTEIARLKTQRASLRDLVQYINVGENRSESLIDSSVLIE